ncbi:cytochrome-c peroxidase [Bacterioplanes sanyensis]|uniref:cytochrome-c peroxidase n=1 Tax=Bacterioplanes sanyensis TaxID=1249553 RepID=UPI0016741099|nr:cytochrome c peroxidase [Bacterioplanes sanyensis]GGY55473.1 cytochrome-c peroxidase [Bacterioplanes sanyensis]
MILRRFIVPKLAAVIQSWLARCCLSLAFGLFSLAAQADLRAQAQAIFGDGSRPVAEPAAAEVALGRKLFFDARIGVDGTSCASCHAAEHGGADGRATAIGAFGRQGSRNTPTIVDIVPQIAMHWTGDRRSLAHQAISSLTAPPAYAHETQQAAVNRMTELADLKADFERVYGEVSAENWGRALTAYQQALTTESDFDRFLQGRADLGEAAKRGLQNFMQIGCAGCHSGPLLGGQSYQKFGLVADYTRYTGSAEDIGRQQHTGKASDYRVFKVPPLKHAVQTAPYFHDGSVSQLSAAIDIMAKVQLGQTLSPAQVSDMVAFLTAASAPMPALLSPPELNRE